MHAALLLSSYCLGGAERQFIYLARGLAQKGHRVTLACLFSGGPLHGEAQGVEGLETVDLLGPSPRHPFLKAFRAGPILRTLLKEKLPDVLYSSAFLTNYLAAKTGPKIGIPVVWGLRSSGERPWKRDFQVWLGRPFVKRVSLSIFNSQAGLATFHGHWYLSSPAIVIPNGIDLERFQPCLEERNVLKKQLGIPREGILVGLVGRLTPEKDHGTFLKAAALALRKNKDLFFACISPDTASVAQKLGHLVSVLGLDDRMTWVAGSNGIESTIASLDILCSSSRVEGFSNVIGEAMACEVPCVVTDVGDSARIVGPTGIVVNPKNPNALAEGLLEMASRSRAARKGLGKSARERIRKEFGLERMIDRVESALVSVVQGDPVERRGAVQSSHSSNW